ncbi:unnamed protein product [Closterium sp. NIES-65]|nr:unnamed protein product [Closterium sp. NIES-65]
MAAVTCPSATVSRASLAPASLSGVSSRKNVSFSSFTPKANFGVKAAAGRVTMEVVKDKPRDGSKEPSKETLLTPRFYTTDFDEMERVNFTTLDATSDINPYLNQAEFDACLEEFKADYNQTHFVRTPEFKAAADKIQGPAREIFVEFLERSCTAEFSGFLLYKELGRRLKARKYTFFKPQYILYATYLSEKIGYWRYITIWRHLAQNPEYQCYPIFQKFENWCQDENRHGDFFTAMLKCYPKFLQDWSSKLWARFFCLSVYVTMYLNDHQRTAFYEGLGLNTKQFNMHVIIETNKTTARIFPAVLDVENPEFQRRLDVLVGLNQKLVDIGKSDAPDALKNVQRFPVLASFIGELLALYFMRPVDSGSVDFIDNEAQVVY